METHSAAPMDPDVTDPMSTQTQYPSTNATSAVTVASPALHNYSTVPNHPGIALSTHHHSHLPPGYDTSQWYGATTNHPRPSLAPFEMPRMLSYPRYQYVPNASGHGMPQGFPTAYGPQYYDPRYLPPGVVFPTYGHVPHDYNTLANWHTQINPNTPHSMTTMPYEYLPQRPVVNTLYGNVVNVRNPPHTRLTALPQFRGQPFDRPVNTSHYPPPQRETISPYPINSVRQVPMPNELHYTAPPYRPLNALYGNEEHEHPSQFILRSTTPLQFQGQPSEWPINTYQRPSETIPTAVAIDTNLASSDHYSPQDDFDCQSEESLQGSLLPTAPIVSLHNDLPLSSLTAEQSGLSLKISGETEYHDNTHLFSQVVLSENNLKLVHEKLYPIRSQWSNFGLALGLPPSTINQISKDHKTCEDCFYETLDRLFQSREITWSKITEALKKPTIQQNNLATEIERAVLEMDPPTPAPVSLVWNLSLEKLCRLPVDKVWYQLGLWLGVKEYRLIDIKNKDKKTKLLFEAFLEFLYDSTDYRYLCRSLIDSQKKKAQRLLESETYDDFILLFPQDKRIDARKIVGISKALFPRLLTALIKVGKREVAENICSKKGVLLTGLTGSEPPPECVVMYADYLKSKYREMSILPDPDWPPSITTKEHYTNLALIQKEKNEEVPTKKDLNIISKDYIHGNIDRIIAKKTNIDLEEVFYPIINPKTNESRLTILMDGAPGVGKTTITRKVCIDWADGDILPEYQLVILIPLRELNILQKLDKKLRLSDILLCDSEELQQNIEKHIMQVFGAGTLIIFDGFDELGYPGRKQSLVLDIIRGSKFPLCSVMITSRPYASQLLRSLSRVNHHIEVLGFTEKQIHDCICTNIPGKEGDTLIQKLKERLDIGSLCYIPLNCRILLFVYKIEEFSLPSTITELYEVFLLHTIKRFAQKVAIDEDVSSDIIAARKLNQIPLVITVQLNALSKFALEGIEQGKLVFDDKNLREHVSLGLLNSLHCFTITGEATFFQFLHLTIQEFLAARYVASDAMTDKERKSFIRSNIENETYRMTLLFLAGLTGLSFLSSSDSLLQHQSSFLSGSSKKERTLFLAQIIYESKSCSNYILSDLNECLDMSNYHLTKFDCLVLAHLMSNTPRDFVWEIIDLSNCGITTYSVLLITKHSEHSKLPGITLSNTLSFFDRRIKNVINSSIPIASVVTLLSSSKDLPLEELTLPLVNFETCKYMVQLSQALVNLKALRTFKIHHYESPRQQKLCEESMISKKEFVLLCSPLSICSNSLIQLLKFTSAEIDRFKIDGGATFGTFRTFQECSTCGTLGEDAVKSLCRFLGKCKNIEQIKISDCCLKAYAMQSILRSLSKSSTVSCIHIMDSDSGICDRELVEMLEHLPRKCTFIFSSKKISIVLKTDEDDLDVSNHDRSKPLRCETFLTNIKCVFPRRFTSLSVEVKDTDETVLEYLSYNPNLKMITLTLDEIPQDKVVIRTETSNRMILKLSKSLTSIRIEGPDYYQDYNGILKLVAEGVRQSNTLLCMEVVCAHRSFRNRSDSITGLITLLNSLKSTPVQRLCFKNVLFNSVCTEAFIQLLSHNQNITDLAIKGSTYFTDSSCTPSSPNTWTFFRSLQMKSLAILSVSHNNLKASGTVALLAFLRLNPQLAMLEASDCYLTDDLFTDTHYWETSSLKELTIDKNNCISVEGWTNLFQSLRRNTSLIKLNCYSNCYNIDIGETIISNKCIQYLTIHQYAYNSSQYNTDSLAKALIQNLTLKEIRYGYGDEVYDLKREIQKLKRDKNVTISPEWNLKIRTAY